MVQTTRLLCLVTIFEELTWLQIFELASHIKMMHKKNNLSFHYFTTSKTLHTSI